MCDFLPSQQNIIIAKKLRFYLCLVCMLPPATMLCLFKNKSRIQKERKKVKISLEVRNNSVYPNCSVLFIRTNLSANLVKFHVTLSLPGKKCIYNEVTTQLGTVSKK